jgi:hypothetical protein
MDLREVSEIKSFSTNWMPKWVRRGTEIALTAVQVAKQALEFPLGAPLRSTPSGPLNAIRYAL